ncbi:hypothetical protein A464_639 [Salmonella bongori N268-08]|uniref:Uncharacterized protein n=1 Tax=Salmonella bongori N268-08 TaxID=1197719 RepID=S5N5R3_SALBN|nr:hypothetical protein A464_639 [Salmonella bongori N268-08]
MAFRLAGLQFKQHCRLDTQNAIKKNNLIKLLKNRIFINKFA